jgi:hypothetical protein
MKQIPPTKNVYHVCTGEEVTLEFMPFAGADPDMITISIADQPGEPGREMKPDPDKPDTPTFTFTVSRPVGGSISIQYECDFSGDVTADTRVELTLSGSQGAQQFKGPTVFGDDQSRQVGLSFDVRDDCQ